MKLPLAFFFLLIFCFLPGSAQQHDVKALVEAWKIADTSQTHRAEETYSQLKSGSEHNYHQTLARLYSYLDHHQDNRLKVRVIMYDILGKAEFSIKRGPQDFLKLGEAVKLVNRLQDDQLTAELYALLGQMDFNNNYLLYNMKAIELQRKIGFQHFSFVHNRFFSSSLALYRTADYRQSIAYGLECLKFKNTDLKNWDSRVYIFQLDVLGASYRQLAEYDRSKYYYQQIIDTLMVKPDRDTAFQKLWLGISNGNIGRMLVQQGDLKNAVPLVQQYLQASTEFGSWNNMAMAQNTLAEILRKQKRYQEAVAGFRKAYSWSAKDFSLSSRIDAAKGLADVYRIIGNQDSAYRYFNLYHQYKDDFNAQLSLKRYSAAKNQINFDNTERNLERANNKLSQERVTRNVILGGIALLTLIVLLLYNHRMQEIKYKTAEIDRKRKEAEESAANAKLEVTEFTRRIVEKNNLIFELQKSIERKETTDTSITGNLMQYTLLTDTEWEKFRSEFTRAYPDFFAGLKRKMPQVNPAEERLAALMFLKLTPYQMANTLGISKDSVARSKRRLKQRLQLPAEADLEVFIDTLC